MLSTSGRVSPNLRDTYQYLPQLPTGWVTSPGPHHLNKGADRACFGHNVCSTAIYVGHDNDWPAEREKTLKGLKEVAPGLVVPRDIVDLEVPEIGRIYLYAEVNHTCLESSRPYRVEITFPTGVWIDKIEVRHYRVLEYCCSGDVCGGIPPSKGLRAPPE